MKQRLNTRLTRGHQIASGLNPKSPYPGGSIELQRPFFKALGLDLYDCHPATLNLSIAPHTFHIKQADHQFQQLNWSDVIAPENFSFVAVELEVEGALTPAWIYYPHPETKQRDHHNQSLLEVIAPFVPGLEYGCELALWIDTDKVAICPGKVAN